MAPRKVPQRCEHCDVVFLPRNSTGKRLQRFCSRACAGHRTGSSLWKAGQAQTRTHGLSRTPQYGLWRTMRARCLNPRNVSYHLYGARGITVCERWLNDYSAFLADVGPRPSPQHTLDRYPNNDGHYEPGNVRWATPTQQHRNKRTNRLITFRGDTRCLEDWAEHYGLTRDCLRSRLRMGWSIEAALLTPVGGHR